jgi:hypothetical protein
MPPRRPSRARSSKSPAVSFKVTFPRGKACCALEDIGVDAKAFRDLDDELRRKASKPYEAPKPKATVECRYTASDSPAMVRVTVLRGPLPTELRIEVDDRKVGEKIRDELLRAARNYEQDAARELSHSQTYAELDKILARHGLVYHEVRYLKKPLPRPAIEAIMQLCKQTQQSTTIGLHMLLTEVAKPDREFVARWLIDEFKKEDGNDQLGVRLYEVAVPAIGDELIGIIQNRRYGDRRGDLCMSLAKTKHKRAAEVIASVLGEDGCTYWAIKCLGTLRATHYVDAIRKYLRDADPDVRREAKKTLKKLGFPVETPPQPVHLAKARRAIPKGLEEWSANLDIGELDPVLKSLSRCIHTGFGPNELLEVEGVVDEMKVNQTKVFCFPVASTDKKKSDLWVVIFMDDEDSPDLEIYAKSEIIREFAALVDKS